MNQTEICNMALSKIKRQRIDSLNDPSEEAKECSIYYEHIRKQLLRLYPWGFARHVEKLALRVDKVPGWDFCYGYPRDCLAITFVFDEMHAKCKEMERQEFQALTVTGADKVIATNVQDAWAEYTYNVRNTDVFSEEFVEAMACMLAASLAIPLTGNTDFVRMNKELAEQAIQVAMRGTVTEQERRTIYPHKYQLARFR